MSLRSSDLQSDSDLDSILNSCDVFVIWVPKLLLRPIKIRILAKKRPNLAHIGLAGSFGALLVGGCGARAVSCKTPIYLIKFTIIAMYLIISDMDLNGLGKLLLDSDSGYHIAMAKIHRSSWNSCMKCFRDIFVKCKFDVHFHIRCFCNISTILWKWSSKSRFLKKISIVRRAFRSLHRPATKYHRFFKVMEAVFCEFQIF